MRTSNRYPTSEKELRERMMRSLHLSEFEKIISLCTHDISQRMGISRYLYVDRPTGKAAVLKYEDCENYETITKEIERFIEETLGK